MVSLSIRFLLHPPALGFAAMLSRFTNSGIKPVVANILFDKYAPESGILLSTPFALLQTETTNEKLIVFPIDWIKIWPL